MRDQIFFEKMEISEIIKTEQENTQIVLHKEGLFLRAYERSAFLFVKYIREYQDITMLRSQMKREYKFTIGERLLSETIELIINIYKANRSKEKKEIIAKAQENTEIIRLLLRLLKDIKEISLKRFIALNQKIEMVSKQLTGWMKYQKEKQ